MPMQSLVKVIAIVAAACIPAALGAQTYPAKPIRIIVGFTPGAGVDIAMRLIAPKIGDIVGQQVIVDNRPGAGGNIGAEIVARAPADGYTLFAAGAPAAISQTLYSKLSYDLVRDFEAVALVASTPMLLVVHPSLPARTVKEFVAIAKSPPATLPYASTGSGSTPHLTAEMLKMQTGIQILHIPYKGTPPALADLLSGNVTFMFANTLSVLPHVQSGRLRALAITSAKRSATLPAVPTVAETYAGFESGTWYGLAAPSRTPQDAIARLNDAVVRVMQLPEIQEKFLVQGSQPLTGTAQQADAYVRAEAAKWSKVVKASNVKAD